MAGINRALPQEISKFAKMNESVFASQSNCVFISYKSEDIDIAKNIAEYIKVILDTDVYLDDNDYGLKHAVATNNHKQITAFINKGINMSTHILCLVTDKTQTSWWVPYEIGYGKKGAKAIGILQPKTVADIPSFLKIEHIVKHKTELAKFVSGPRSLVETVRYESIFKSASIDHILD